jgi:Domain of unknown function (DUF4832)
MSRIHPAFLRATIVALAIAFRRGSAKQALKWDWRFLVRITFAAALGNGGLHWGAEAAPSDTPEIIHVTPQAFEGALRNPLMGLTGRVLSHSDWESLTHHYIGWREIEGSQNDGVAKIKAYCDDAWNGLPEQNVKVIPRVYLEYPNKPDGWPDGLRAGDYSSPEFQLRLRSFIEKLGEAWNTDPRVAFIELGIFGKWGEHHSPAPSAELQQLAGDAFARAFPDKRVSVRQTWAEFVGHGFGEYWDSFAHWDQMADNGREIAALNEKTGLFERTYIGGEVAYDWGNWRIQPGESPTASLADPRHLEFIINTVRWVHCTQLEWIGDYERQDGRAVAGAAQLQKALGYRFVLDDVSYSSSVGDNDELKIVLRVRNLGSAPFYYRWPLEASLLDPRDHHVVWKETFSGVDIRDWQPGRSWSSPIFSSPSGSNAGEPARATWPDGRAVGWSQPPAEHCVQGAFKPRLPQGQYLLALEILDPAGMVPSVCFATTQYLKGGRHPIGLVGFGGVRGSKLPADFRFDDQFSDRTLHYEAGQMATPATRLTSNPATERLP